MAKRQPSAPGDLTAKGLGGRLTVNEDAVTIHRKGFYAFTQHGLAGDKRIPMSSITSVQFKRAGIAQGFIQFGVLGGIESRRGVNAAIEDENSVAFTVRNQREFEAVRAYVEARIGQQQTAQPATSRDVAEQLRDLAKLRDDGHIDDAEFQRLKATIVPND